MRRARAAAALAWGLALGVAVAPAMAAPAIRFDALTVDLGPVVQGERPSCTFSFANAGDAALRILSVEPTCGCTTALLSGSTLAPGARGAIQVFFDSSNFSGEVEKEVAVHSTDPDRPTTLLRLLALVEPEVLLEPVQLVFAEVHPGTPMRDLAFLTNRRGETIFIRAAQISPSSFSFRIPLWTASAEPLAVEPGERIDIEIEIAPPEALAMPLAGELALTIQGPRKTTFLLKLLALPAAAGPAP